MRVILITGGNGGLGHAVARAFLHEADDNLVWLAHRERSERVLELAGAYPDRCFAIELEVTRPESWAKAVERILADHGRIDVLVNNAGRNRDGLLGTMTASAWKEVLEANLDGAFHGCQAVLPTMISQRAGRIINVSSLSALLAPAGQTNYAAAKAGMIGLTQSLAKEVARIGITVNAICPGYIESGAVAGMGEEERKAALAKVPMRRFGKPEEVAAAIRFLACAEAGYITGSTLKIDGGIL